MQGSTTLCAVITFSCFAALAGAFTLVGNDGKHEGDAFVLHIKEKVRERGSSNSNAANTSTSRVSMERREWNNRRLNTGDAKVIETDTSIRKNEAGSSHSSTESNRRRGERDEDRSKLLINGEEISSKRKGSSTKFSETKKTSSSTQFERQLEQERQKQLMKQSLDLRCIAEREVTVYVLIHLNQNWRQKLLFLRKLLRDAYEPEKVNFVCILFNRNVRMFSSIGPGALTSKQALLQQVTQYEQLMQNIEQRGSTADWNQFQLNQALLKCLGFASLYQDSSRQAMMVSYFDDHQEILPATLDSASSLVRMNAWSSLFPGSLCLLESRHQNPASKWSRLASIMSSSDKFVLSRPREELTLQLMAQMVGKLCAEKFLAEF